MLEKLVLMIIVLFILAILTLTLTLTLAQNPNTKDKEEIRKPYNFWNGFKQDDGQVKRQRCQRRKAKEYVLLLGRSRNCYGIYVQGL